ncbi:LysR family transcriptional regulator [Alteromonas sp. KUL49]|uniref:LysR family transcriptional regulator n=1 Tax=Alteromonas sp. KUL49 TaxID=2480798 RepID=UPI00102EEC53|nr:LysR family transcriptional regulator [Alteromonas sp. KUL49]TAP39266.1 LysR family transcriptional regulator [Alteromonas sp. KUL49]GEA12046.1 LysR family transcriptional regulator [Alteromonas sp. KUL49]
MDKLHTMQIFIEVAKHQSFSAAAEALNLSAPAVTRAIANLEHGLGVKLLHRTTRHVRLTDAGQGYLGDAKRILESIEEAEAAATGSYAKPKGTLTITAPVLFGQMHVMPIVTEYLERHTGVQVRAVFLDRVTNLMEEQFDVAIRIDHLKDTSLYATQVGRVGRIAVGAPSYFEQYGYPQHPSELSDHRIIATSSDQVSTWSFNDKGKKLAVKVSPRLACNQSAASINAAISGYGIARTMSYQVGEAINDGRLVRVLEDYENVPFPVSVVRLEGRQSSAKVRHFVDLAIERLRENSFIG